MTDAPNESEFPEAVKHKKVQGPVALTKTEDATWLTDPDGIEDAIKRRNESFRVLVQVAKLIAERMEELNDVILNTRATLEKKGDKNVDILVTQLNKLVKVLRDHADETKDPGKMNDFLTKIQQTIASMDRKIKESNDDKRNAGSTPFSTVAKATPDTSAAMGFDLSSAVPTGDNGDLEGVQVELEGFQKNVWENAIQGRNTNFIQLTSVVRKLYERMRLLFVNYAELSKQQAANDTGVPEELDTLRKQLNELVLSLSNQDKSEEAEQVQELRKGIFQLKSAVSAGVDQIIAQGQTGAGLSVGDLSNKAIGIESRGVNKEADTGINPPAADQKLKDPEETQGQTFAVDKWVNAIKTRNINFAVLVDAIYELVEILDKLKVGIEAIRGKALVQRVMHPDTIKLVNDLYKVYEALAEHQTVFDQNRTPKSEWDLSKAMKELYDFAKPKLTGALKAGDYVMQDTDEKKDIRQAQAEDNEDGDDVVSDAGDVDDLSSLESLNTTPSAASSMSDRTAQLSERVVRLEAKTRAAASELLRSNPSGVPVARSSLGSRSGHSRNGKNYKLNLAF